MAGILQYANINRTHFLSIEVQQQRAIDKSSDQRAGKDRDELSTQRLGDAGEIIECLNTVINRWLIRIREHPQWQLELVAIYGLLRKSWL